MVASNLYTDLTAFKRRFAGDSTLDSVDAAELEAVIEASSRRVDAACRRRFYVKTGTRVRHGNGENAIPIPDLVAETSIKLDEDGDRAFELTLTQGTDYYLERHGYEDPDAIPFTLLRLDEVNGSRSTFLNRLRLVEIIGRWGFTEERETLVSLAAEALDETETAFDIDDGTEVAVGQTIQVDTEDMYISAISTNTLTVTRGVNNTTAATHLDDAPIKRFIWVPEVREATLILAGRLWKRRETGYANVIANPVVGQFETFKRTDPDVAELLAPLVRDLV